MPIDLVMEISPEPQIETHNFADYVTGLQNQASRLFELARRRLGAAAERRKATYDVRCQRHQLQRRRMGLVLVPSKIPFKVVEMAKELHWSVSDSSHNRTSELRFAKVTESKAFRCTF